MGEDMGTNTKRNKIAAIGISFMLGMFLVPSAAEAEEVALSQEGMKQEVDNGQNNGQPESKKDTVTTKEEKNITRLSISPESQELVVGGSMPDGGPTHGDMAGIEVTAFYSDNTSKILGENEVEWFIGDENIASIVWWAGGVFNDSYVISAGSKVGTTTITARVGESAATATMTSIPKDMNDASQNWPANEQGKIESIPDQVYTGGAISPKVKFIFGIWDWIENEDYMVSYTNNKEVGTATVTVTGINRLKGSVSKTFKILKNNNPIEYPAGTTDHPVIKDVSQGVTFTLDVDFDKFVGVSINGRKLVRDIEYTAKRGSTIITLLPDYLAALGNGNYEAIVEFTDGTAKVNFSKTTPVLESSTEKKVNSTTKISKVSSPKTGDFSNGGLSLIMLFLSLVTMCGITKFKIK